MKLTHRAEEYTLVLSKAHIDALYTLLGLVRYSSPDWATKSLKEINECLTEVCEANPKIVAFYTAEPLISVYGY